MVFLTTGATVATGVGVAVGVGSGVGVTKTSPSLLTLKDCEYKSDASCELVAET